MYQAYLHLISILAKASLDLSVLAVHRPIARIRLVEEGPPHETGHHIVQIRILGYGEGFDIDGQWVNVWHRFFFIL